MNTPPTDLTELVSTALRACDREKLTDTSSAVVEGDHVRIPLEFAKKFARAVARECALVALDATERAEPSEVATDEDYLVLLANHSTCLLVAREIDKCFPLI